MNTTGGGPPNEPPLNKFERRVLQILGESFYRGTGCEEIAVVGISNQQKKCITCSKSSTTFFIVPQN